TVTDTAGLTDVQAIAVTVTDVNDNTPVITSNGGGASASINVAENTTAVTTVTATDADAGATLTYSLVGGADAAKFTINSTTGVLAFAAAPDFEAPTDSGANNVYDVTVQVSDGLTTDTQNIAVTVTDADEIAPTLSTSTPADDATAVAVGSNIVLTFNENVVAGTGNIVISNGTDTRTIPVGDAQVTFSGNTVTINPSTDLVSNTAYNVQMASGVILDVAGNPYAGISNATTLNFDTADTTGPSVSGVAITSATGLLNGTLNAGDVVSATVTMNEATLVVTTGGTPQLALDIGGTTVQANYVSGSGTTALVFNYTIQAGQTDANGIAIAANSLALNGGTLKDAAGNNATITHAQVNDNGNYRVDTTAPISFGATFANTANAVVTLTYSEAVTYFGGLSLTKIAPGVDPWAGTAIGVTSVDGLGTSTLTVNTNTTLAATDVVRVRYDAGGFGTLADLAGNPFASGEIFIGGSGASVIDLDGYGNGGLPITLRGNAGNDILIGTDFNDVLVDGGGVDGLYGGHGADTLRLVENGGSLAYSPDVVLVGVAQSTVAAMDHVRGSATAPTGTGFDITSATVANHDVLDLFAVNIAGNVGTTNGTDVGSIAQHSVASGIVSFLDAGGNAILINAGNAADAASYLSANFTAVGTTAAFKIDTDGNGSVDSLRVFQKAGTVPLLGDYVIPDTLIELSDLIGIDSAVLGTVAGANVVQIQDTQVPDPVGFALASNGVRLDFAENTFATPSLALTLQMNGAGAVLAPSSIAGNGTSSLTVEYAVSLAPTDWALLHYAGTDTTNSFRDAANNALIEDAGGFYMAWGGSGNNTINLGPTGLNLSDGYDISGFAGNDTLIGSSGDDWIQGGTGADTMTGGAGSDDFNFEQGDSPAVTAMDLGGDNILNTGDTFSFASGVDRITDLDSGEGLGLDKAMSDLLGNAGAPGYMGSAPSNGLATDQGYFAVRGDYLDGGSAGSSGTFTVNTAAGADTLIVWDGDSSAAVTQTGIVLSGVTLSELNLYTGSSWISHV
ncbi:MAG: Ig-like domain-containing protein, partial [Pseudomonadota bacterium]|nr:Ig-like domain-containing protein [Pseudomonadota bacterium]MDP2352801.1 Ig-like domain-containing protein [Pseudomonadota bacterium]